ncbi:hypothetical protein B0T20DRAFT_116723 [Sordaria brevicollis]|uniref:Uncharacterized protein n=1 Tax=Sordaria brevicollis TaxID=83679 RepID=A0AAE0PK70_SORBR|nr:hypothetical protein B0T20DRAFT_116723 [Sordaria brevicollis]
MCADGWKMNPSHEPGTVDKTITINVIQLPYFNMTDETREPGQPLPGPDVSVTRTRAWLRLRHPESASASEAVIMNNLAVVSDQLSQLLALQTTTSLGGRKRRRTSSVGSAASTATTDGRENRNVDGSDGELSTQQNDAEIINSAINNLSNTGGKWFNTIYDAYKVFTQDTGSFRYRAVSKHTGPVAEAFWKFCLEQFDNEEDGLVPDIEEESVLDDLKRLTNIDAKVRIYVELGKKFHADQKAAAARKSPRSGTAGPDSQHSTAGASQSTRTGDSQQSRTSKRQKTKGKKTGRNVSFGSEIANSEDDGIRDTTSSDEDL